MAHFHALLNCLAEAEADTIRIELTTQNVRLTGNTALLVKRDAIVAPLNARALRGETIPDMDGGLELGARDGFRYGPGRGASAPARAPAACLLRLAGLALPHDLLFDIAQPVLAEKEFVAHQETGRAECAVLERRFGIGE